MIGWTHSTTLCSPKGRTYVISMVGSIIGMAGVVVAITQGL